MPWLTTSKTRIIKHQAYRINVAAVTAQTLNQLINQQMAEVLSGLPDLVPIIEADLATLELLDTALTVEQGSTSAGLTRADVLEWDVDKKTSGISSRYDAIRMRVANLLSQAIASESTSGGAWGSGGLMRG